MSAKHLSGKQLSDLLGLLRGADSVELKLTVPAAERRATVNALGLDPLDGQIRQVVFFDTPDLDLDRHGVVVRARRVAGVGDDSVVKLRPVTPDSLPDNLRRTNDFVVEVDAIPGGFVCSGSYKGKLGRNDVRPVLDGEQPIRKLFSKPQRAFFAKHAPEGTNLDDLAVLGPINVVKLKFNPPELGRKVVAELWQYPDGSQILELSTKCLPAEAFEVAAETKAMLADKGIDISGEQQTKTRRALEYYAGTLS